MKRFLLISGLILATFTLAAAQGKTATAVPNYAGTWALDLSKTKLPEMGGPKIASQTLSITQDAKQITTSADTKMDGQMTIPVQTHTYNLDGSESDTELKMVQMSAPGKAKAVILDGGKLQLGFSATFDTPQGAMSVQQTDVMELMDGGKTLKIHRSLTTPRGTDESDRFYTKQ